MGAWRRRLWPLLAAALLGAEAHAADVRGMTVSTPTWGWEWGTERMDGTLDTLRDLGVNWVSIHPYAAIGADGSVQWRDLSPESPPEWLARPIREAHARGMKVLVTPHLAYWGSPFSWRGAVAFPDPRVRARFFREYRAWVVALAQASAGADGFVVGSELDGTIGDEAGWREVIAGVRAVWAGPVTYAANWDAFERVPFWDALDVVGIQAYFPLVDGGGVPDDAQLQAGWERVAARLRAFHQRTGKHIVFTELGFDASEGAAARPWEGGAEPTEAGRALQARCLRVVLRGIDHEPGVIGAFLWKWFPGEVQRGDFRMSEPSVRRVIAEVWRP
ncbi:MAG: hypothetical protein R3F59_15575 [Myxococcota bacterium]